MGLLTYHRSINSELVATRNRVRDLLEPGVHWGEDGLHKEAILQQVLRRHIPDTIQLTSGFVRLKDSSTNQLDLMITNSSGPILFRENNFQIVTPNLVEAVIEVKTKLNSTQLKNTLNKLADNVAKIRSEKMSDQWARSCTPQSSINPWAGLFTFEECNISPKTVVKILKEVSQNKLTRSIQAVCLGPNVFVRFWSHSPHATQETFYPSWHYYHLDNLAFSYFLGNAIWMHEDSALEQRHWFPIDEGKERHLKAKLTINPPYD